MPNCSYCAKPLTDNDIDSETLRYYSSHTRCAFGDYDAITDAYRVGGQGFTTLKRAIEHGDHLALNNRGTRIHIMLNGEWAATCGLDNNSRLPSRG